MKYYIIWEVRHDIKTVIFHRLVKDYELSQALDEVHEKAVGEVRFQEVTTDDSTPDVDKMYR